MSYRSLFRRPFVIRLLTGSWIGRLPFAMAVVAIPLAVRHSGGSYGFVGAMAATFAVAAAAGSPVLGRLVDRLGQTRVLLWTAPPGALGFVTIALFPQARAAALAAAAVAGFATPPIEACLRALWPRLVLRADLERAYAVDSAAQELIFITGPLVVAVCVAVIEPAGALLAAAALGPAGVLVVATAAPSRTWRSQYRAAHWLGPMRSGPLVILLCSLTGAGFAVGVLNVYVVSYAEAQHVPGGAPALLALNATGSMIGAVAYGLRRWPLAPRGKAVLFMCGMIIGYGLLPLHPRPAFMVPVMLLTGLFLAPLLTVVFLMVGELAPKGTSTEAFAWIVTLFTVGMSMGAAVVGLVIERAGERQASLCGSLGLTAGLVILLCGYPMLRIGRP
jgi:MFS family permease